jgi:hypothetical protein
MSTIPDMWWSRDPGVTADPEAVAAAAHLLRARTDWGAMLLRSALLLLAYGVIGMIMLKQLTGYATDVISTVITIVTALQAVLVLVALAAVVAGTFRLRGLDRDVRAEAASQIQAAATPGRGRGRRFKVYPGRARAPRDWRFRVYTGSLLALWLLAMVDFLPQQVNAIAYLAGPGPTVSFAGHSYRQDCGRGGCITVTEGTLLTQPPVSAIWPDQAALGRPISVRRPAWSGWGPPEQLMNGDWAGPSLGFGAFLDLISVGVLIGLAYALRSRLRSGRQDPSGQAADRKYPDWLLRRYPAQSERGARRR